ncbi:MAG: 50S ribosomal protein L17 [Spartobacteria bacterium]|nr:50S ribosomal protein L17 [Spartobacteria bacterium]
MRHRKKTIKLGRKSAHREAMLAGMVSDLIAEKRIITTLPKARAARGVAEKLVTMAKKGTLAARRIAISRIRRPERVKILFEDIAPVFKDRPGGYTRILKMGRRDGDNAELAILEWVEDYTIQKPASKIAAKAEKS